MKKTGYKQSDVDHTLFIKRKLGKITTFIVYVDDMVVTRNDSSKSSSILMVALINTRRDWLQKVIHKSMELITRILLLL